MLTCLPAAPASAQQYTDYTNQRLGFSFQVPANWPAPEKKSVATLIFSGPQGSLQYRTTINVQLVQRKANANLQTEAKEIIKQWATAPKYKLLSRQTGSLAGKRGMRLVVQYQLPGTEEMFKQEQFIVDRPPYFFWIGYTAPLELFDANRHFMAKAIETLKFMPMQAAATPPRPPRPQTAAGQPQVYDLTLCQGVRGGKPVGAAQVFSPDTKKVFAWFRFKGLSKGAVLKSVWYYGQGGSLKKAIEASAEVQGELDWGQFNINTTQGRRFPAGDYRIDIYLGQKKLASASFKVQ
jgi:hypothetical protein